MRIPQFVRVGRRGSPMRLSTADIPAPARDRAVAGAVCRLAGFRVVAPLAVCAAYHSWLVEVQGSVLQAELTLYRSVTAGVRAANSHTAGVAGDGLLRAAGELANCRERAALVSPEVLGGLLDQVYCVGFGTLVLRPSRERLDVPRWLAFIADPDRSSHADVSHSAAAAALLCDALHVAEMLRSRGLCLGRLALDDVAVTTAGGLCVTNDAALHAIPAGAGGQQVTARLLGRQCCVLGMHPDSLVELAEALLPAGSRASRVLSHYRDAARTDAVGSRYERLVLLLSDECSPERVPLPEGLLSPSGATRPARHRAATVAAWAFGAASCCAAAATAWLLRPV